MSWSNIQYAGTCFDLQHVRPYVKQARIDGLQ